MNDSSAKPSGLSAAQRELLAKRLKGARVRGETSQPSIPQRPADVATPISLFQEGLWLVDRLDPGDPAYNIILCDRLHGALDAAALERAFQHILRRHEILRTHLQEQGDEVLQAVDPAYSFVLPVMDLQAVPGDRRDAEVKRIAAEEGRQRMDLQRGPLLRARLLRLAADDHALIVVVHHIVFDGWSSTVLYGELAAFYSAESRGQTVELPGLPIQYGDFAVWHRQQMSGPEGARQLSYWKKQLAGAPDLLELPSDRPRPAHRTGAGGCEFMMLPAQLEDDLKRLSQQHNTTMFVLLLAAFKVLLLRYTGREDLIVGSPAAGRARPELERLIGYFVNMLVLRTDAAGNPAFLDLLYRVRETVAQALGNADVPFDRLVEELHPVRAANFNPLFQVGFQLHEEAPGGPLKLGDVGVEIVTVANDTSKFDLTLAIARLPGGLQLALEYSSDLFDAPTAARMLAHYSEILRGIVANPQCRAADLPMLSEEERQESRQRSSGPLLDISKQTTLPEHFEARVRAFPDRIAAVCGSERLTYAQLNSEANRIAHRLRALGVGPGARVALCMERSLSLLAALIGIQKAGGAYVPLDPGFPPDRLAFMLADSGAKVLLASDGIANGIERPDGVAILDVSAPAGISDAQSVENLPPAASASDPVYVLYTSGSTGRPKGVEVCHGSLINFLLSMAREPGLRDTDVLAAVTTISFDIAGLELYLPLCTGASIDLIARETAADGQALAARLAAGGATVLQATPATWRLLIEAGWRGPPGFRAFCGGEALPKELADALLERVSELWNLYGPTETTIWSTLERIRRGARIAVGRPIANTQVYIVGPGGEQMPAGSPGEIWIGGAGVALGYHGRPELTAERFLQDRFSEQPGARLYRTGDLGRWTADGRLEHLGRLDQQVKIRGFRIELGEIESVLDRCSRVRQSAVIAGEDGSGDRRLVAYLVADGAEEAVLDSVRTALAGALPDYMVPRSFVFLEALPLTANGKVDRKALLALAASTASAHERTVVEPRTPAEIQVRDVFREVLERTDVGVTDNFFDLGGHSLKAARLISRLRSVCGHDLPLKSLFEYPTVAGLAGLIDQLGAASTGPQSGSAAQLALQQRAIVPLQPKGTGYPIFAVPGHNGDVFCYRFLSQCLGGEQPFYGLQPPGVDGQSAPLDSVDALADYFVAQIEAFRPQGPYIVAGFCAGGTVALEIARRLEQRQALHSVLLFGAYHASNYRLMSQAWLGLNLAGRKLRQHSRALLSMGVSGVKQYVMQRARSIWSERKAFKDIGRDPVIAARRRVEKATLRLLGRYRQPLSATREGRLRAPIYLFMPNGEWGNMCGFRTAPWHEVGRSVKEYAGPADCNNDIMLLQPHVRVFAEQLRGVLNGEKQG